MSSEDPHASGMECRYPYLIRTETCDLIHTLPHLLGCFVGKSDGQNVPWIYSHLINQISHSVGQDTGLAASCARQQKERSFRMKHRFFLFFI